MLILICGIPSAGKTTYSKRFENVIHFDDYSRHCLSQYRRCSEDAAKVKGDVCVEGLYNTKFYRKMLLHYCFDQDQKVCIWLDTDVELCCKRENAYRNRGSFLIRNNYKILEPPSLDEGWDKIICIKNNNEVIITNA